MPKDARKPNTRPPESEAREREEERRLHENDLVRYVPLAVLDHRTDAVFWGLLFAQATERVAALRARRAQILLDASGEHAGEAEWPAEYERLLHEQIALESPSPQRFDLVVPQGPYPDQAFRVVYELRPSRGIGKRLLGPWPSPHEPQVVAHLLHPSEAPAAVARELDPVFKTLERKVRLVL
jgi:hypothetical protein